MSSFPRNLSQVLRGFIPSPTGTWPRFLPGLVPGPVGERVINQGLCLRFLGLSLRRHDENGPFALRVKVQDKNSSSVHRLSFSVPCFAFLEVYRKSLWPVSGGKLKRAVL